MLRLKIILYRLVVLSIGCSTLQALAQPSADRSYVKISEPIVGRTHVVTHASLNNVTVNYVDGLGRPKCSVGVRRGSGNTDVASWTEYDSQGRQWKSYLPTNIGQNEGAYPPNASSFTSYACSIHDDSYPYTETLYDGLGRVKELIGPGEAWRSAAGNHSIRHEYRLNTNDPNHVFQYQQGEYGLNCKQFYVKGDTALAVREYYAAATLRVDMTIDEDSSRTAVFTDKSGRIILSRKYDSEIWFVDTYWVYDVAGRLRYVIPPEGAYYMNDMENCVIPHQVVDKWCYVYTYDERDRCIVKKTPGISAQYFVYDKLGHQIMNQDGELRKQQKWNVTKYDANGRVAVEGSVILPGITHGDLLSLWKDSLLIAHHDASLFMEGDLQYTTHGGIMSGFMPYRAIFYDNYDHWTGLLPVPDISFAGIPEGTNAMGLLTGTAETDFSGDVTVTMVVRDSKGNVIREAERDVYGQDYIVATEKTYDFINRISTMKRTTATLSEQTVIRRFDEQWTYNHNKSGKLTYVCFKAGNTEWVDIAKMVYDDYGRLTQQALTTNNLYTADYTYNIRGWLTSIQGVGTKYKENLYYNTPPEGATGVSARWGGDVCANAETRYHLGSPTQMYRRFFVYDGSTKWLTAVTDDDGPRFNESFGYDCNGNVVSIERGSVSGTGGYDILTLTYDGNRLQGISDDADFDDYLGEIPQSQIGEHLVTLDDDGRIKSDESRGVTNVNYNPIGLPSSITMGSDFSIFNSYRSDGKLKREMMREYYLAQVKRYDRITGDTVIVYVPRVRSSTNRRHLGDFILEDGKNPRSYHDWGYVEWLSDNTVRYYWYERDHQGSVRMVRDNSFGIAQSTAYTASGLPLTHIYSGTGDHHLHTGKPWQNTGGLAWYDNRARWYDPVTMRFLAPDPLAGKYHDISPWAWCGNNPLRYSDPTGERIIANDISIQRTILLTLNLHDRGYVEFNHGGYLNRELLLNNNIGSENFNSLVLLETAPELIYVEFDNQYNFIDSKGDLKRKELNAIVDPTFITNEIKNFTDITTGEIGRTGVTLLPSDGQHDVNSYDDNIHIILSDQLSQDGAAQLYSHEANGHAKLYILTHDRNLSSHRVKNYIETNKLLSNAILQSLKETIINMLVK